MSEINDYAGIAAALGLLAAGVWKIWLRLKSDTREDSGDARRHKAEVSQFDHYDGLVKTLRDEVERLSELVKEVHKELEEERDLRRKAEDREAELGRKVQSLELQVAELREQLK